MERGPWPAGCQCARRLGMGLGAPRKTTQAWPGRGVLSSQNRLTRAAWGAGSWGLPRGAKTLPAPGPLQIGPIALLWVRSPGTTHGFLSRQPPSAP